MWHVYSPNRSWVWTDCGRIHGFAHSANSYYPFRSGHCYLPDPDLRVAFLTGLRKPATLLPCEGVGTLGFTTPRRGADFSKLSLNVLSTLPLSLGDNSNLPRAPGFSILGCASALPRSIAMAALRVSPVRFNSFSRPVVAFLSLFVTSAEVKGTGSLRIFGFGLARPPGPGSGRGPPSCGIIESSLSGISSWAIWLGPRWYSQSWSSWDRQHRDQAGWHSLPWVVERLVSFRNSGSLL